MKIISLSSHASCFLYCCLGASTFTFKDVAAFTSLNFLDKEIFQMAEVFEKSFCGCQISRTYTKIHSMDLKFRGLFLRSARSLGSMEFTWP